MILSENNMFSEKFAEFDFLYDGYFSEIKAAIKKTIDILKEYLLFYFKETRLLIENKEANTPILEI